MEWILSPGDSGVKLSAFLKRELGNSASARQIKQLIEQNQCTVNGRIERFASAILAAGDRVSFNFQRPSVSSFEFDQKRVLYQDAQLLAYDKPAGAVCDASGIVKIIHSFCPDAILLHRLDRDTTGVLLFAKTQETEKAMLQLFRQRQVEKTYVAIVDGIPQRPEGVIENYLEKKYQKGGQPIWRGSAQNKGDFASTSWKLGGKGNHASLIYCYPKTGRTHQLRVHLSEMGHPILGDTQYGSRFQCSYRPLRCLLHAAEVRFNHPVSEKEVVIQAPLPADFLSALEAVKIKQPIF